MNLYLVTRTDRYGYDEYTSCVVAWDDEEIPRPVLPWEDYITDYTVDLIGTATEGTERCIIHSAFNAG